MSSKTKYKKEVYRPSASLIVAVKSSKISTNYDYQLLLTKRSARTAYAPNHFVFPGGVFEPLADESIEWLEYFHACGISKDDLEKLLIKQGKRPQPLLTAGINFSRDISLRLTAIRETFEEVGVLLCRPFHASLNAQPSFGKFEEDFDRVKWQKLVHNDAKQFLQLCKMLKVIPDLWSLYEWAVWRSPATATKKFDTVYYFVALDRAPDLLLEPSEMETELWLSPQQFLQLHQETNIWLAPPQVYELSRFTHAHQLQLLLEFAWQRARQHGSTLMFPAYYRCEDGYVSVLPGDDFYPPAPHLVSKEISVPSFVEAFHKEATHRHRFVVNAMHNLKVNMNIRPLDGHLSAVKERFVSKL